MFTDCIRKCCCNSESLAPAVTCISYFASAVMTYNSNTITLRDSVIGIESQWHSSTEVFFFLQHNHVGNSSTRALKFYVNKCYFTKLKATGKSCCIHKHVHATGLSPSDTSLSCGSFKIPRKKYVSVHTLFFFLMGKRKTFHPLVDTAFKPHCQIWYDALSRVNF